jgi:hypothetical protein
VSLYYQLSEFDFDLHRPSITPTLHEAEAEVYRICKTRTVHRLEAGRTALLQIALRSIINIK